MGARSGRKFKLMRGTSVIAGIQSTGYAFNGEPVDITSNDDEGFRTFLADDVGVQSIDMNFSGITKDSSIRALAMAGGSSLMLTDVTLVDAANNDVVACDFFLNSFEETGETDGAVTFTGTLQSSGAWTYTPGA